MNRKKKIEPLTGDALLKKVKELETVSKEDKAKECGYYTITKNGVERVNMMKFLNALIDAEGIELAIELVCSQTITYLLVQLIQNRWVWNLEMNLKSL